MAKLSDHAALIVALGGAAEVAASPEVATLPVTVRAWVARNRVPPEYWPGLIIIAGRKGLSVTADWLMRSTPARRRADVATQMEAA